MPVSRKSAFFRNTQADEAVPAFAIHLGKLGTKRIHCIPAINRTNAPPASGVN